MLDQLSGAQGAAYTLPPEVVAFRDLARQIVRGELLPLEREFLASPHHAYGLTPVTNLRACLPAEKVDHLVALARDTGLWWMGAPQEYGGMGLSMLAQVVLDEEFNYTAVPFPVPEIPNILLDGTEEQKQKYLRPVIEGELIYSFAQTEPGAGSDPGGMMTTKATRRGDRWVINGTKMWISGALESDVILVQAVTDAEKRQRGGITMFLVERRAPGVTIDQPGIATWLGQRAGQYVVHFDDVEVGDDAVLGPVGDGFRLGQRWLTIHDRLMRGPYSLGKMQRALDMSIEWSKQRVTFGKPIAERQAIQWRLVDMYVDLQALRSMTYEMASRADLGEDVRTEAALVKMCASEWGARCLDHAMQIHGAMGESLELPLSYFYRLLRHTQIGGGTTEIQKMLIARKLLRD